MDGLRLRRVSSEVPDSWLHIRELVTRNHGSVLSYWEQVLRRQCPSSRGLHVTLILQSAYQSSEVMYEQTTPSIGRDLFRIHAVGLVFELAVFLLWNSARSRMDSTSTCLLKQEFKFSVSKIANLWYEPHSSNFMSRVQCYTYCTELSNFQTHYLLFLWASW